MAGYGGLGKETVTVRLGGGVDQANDPFLVDSPSVLGAENVRFDDRGALAKRSGHLQTGAAGTDANSVHDVAGTLAVWGPEGAWQRNEAESNWLTMNPCAPRPSRVLTDVIARGNDSLSRADFAMVGSLACVAWQNDTEETVHYQFVDFSSGRPQVLARKLIATIKSQPRLVVISSKGGTSSMFVLVGLNNPVGTSGTLYACTYEVDDADYTFSTPPVSLGVLVNVASQPTSVWDVCSAGTASANYIVMNNLFGVTNALFTQCNSVGSTGTTQTATDFRGYACTVNLASGDVVAVGTDADNVWASICDVPYSLSSTPNVDPLATLENTDVNVRRATVCQLDATGKMFAAFSGRRDVQSASSTEFGLGTDIVEISSAYSMTRQGFVRSMAIAAKARYGLALGGADALLPLCENAAEVAAEGEGPFTNSPTLSPAPVGLLCRPELTVDNEYSVAVVGRFLVDAIAKAGDDFHLSHVAALDDDAYFVATVMTDVSVRGGSLRKTQIDLVRANVWGAPPVRSVTAQGLRLAAGGAGLVCFDGGNVVECTPPMVTVIGRTAQDPDYATGGTLLPLPDPGDAPDDWAGGTGVVSGYVPHYPIRLVHIWTDAKGNRHRGAPSDQYFLVPLNTSGDIDPHNPSMMIGFSAPEPSAMNGDRLQRMDVEVYQAAQPDLETWHRIAVCKPRAHPTVAGWLSITALGPAVTERPLHGFVLQPGEVLSAYPALYTDSEAANQPPPPLLDLCSTQSRLWGLSAERRLDVFHTKPLVPGEAPAFYGASTPVPAEGGEAVGLAALDDKVIVFKERLVFALFGDPGDANGDGSTLQTPRLISGDVGCINALSIVEGPFGVAFLSERGFYALDRGMSFSFIGESVKDVLDGKVVTSGVLVPSESEVRWTYGTAGAALVWNYLTNAWSTWSSFTGTHAALWRGVHTRVSSGGVAYVETPGDWTEGSDEELVVTTVWLKVSGLQRYQRIRRALFLMRHYSGGVRIEVGYDYAPEWIDSVEWTPTELEALRGTDGRVQLLVSQSIQKCEAIRYRITGLTSDGAQGYYPGQAIELVGIDIELGVKRGAFKSITTDAKR